VINILPFFSILYYSKSKGNYEEAIKAFSEAIKIDLRNSEVFKEEELLELAIVNKDLADGVKALEENKYDEAIKLLNKLKIGKLQ
jgi:tetratricopeptide (TPR) repeat protein